MEHARLHAERSAPAAPPFPAAFLWGAATAPHQNEGNNVASDMWAMEQLPGSRFVEPSGDSVDFYHRWREDIDLAVELGFSAFRFGIEWARVEPARGQFSHAELAHYRGIIEYCLERGVEPVVTLHHFANPLWFSKLGGWASPEAVELFAAYVEFVSPALDGVTWVATLNEPNMMGMWTLMSGILQFDDADEARAYIEAKAAAMRRAGLNSFTLPEPSEEDVRRLRAVHARAREVLHARTSAQVGWTIAVQGLVARPGYEEEWARVSRIWEDLFLEESAGDDWVGVQAYSSQLVGPDGLEGPPPGAEVTLTGWAYRPDALEISVRRAAQVAPGVPILITENGIATHDDERRIHYTTGALRGLAAAMADGADVRGYLHWTFLDNFEWTHGYSRPFGLVAVDRQTFRRTPKPSARWLGEIARTGGAGLVEDPA